MEEVKRQKVRNYTRTPRWRPQVLSDETVEVVSPKKKFKARVLLACTWKFKDLPFSFLEYDLEAAPGETRQTLINKLGRLYKFSEQPKPSDTVTVYFME